jgi:hypothetical protein
MKDVLSEKVHQLLTADFLDDGAGDYEVGVGVLPLGAGLEVRLC